MGKFNHSTGFEGITKYNLKWYDRRFGKDRKEVTYFAQRQHGSNVL